MTLHQLLQSLLLLAQTFFSPDGQEGDPELLRAGNSGAAHQTLLGFAFFLAYVTFIPWIGFTVSSVLFVFGFVLRLGRYGIVAAGALAVGISALLWSLFAYLLAVPLPQGSWWL